MLPFLERKDEDLFIYEFKDFGFPTHFHSSLEVIFVKNGQISLKIDKNIQTIHQGELGIVFPNLVHSYERTNIAENDGYILLIGQKLFGEYSEDLAQYRPQNPVVSAAALHKDCIHSINVLHHEAKNLRLQKAYARLFLCRFFENAVLVPKEVKHEDLLHALIDYMGSHFCENLSLASVSEALYVSKFTLSGIFSKNLGINFNDYLNALRINLAMQLMETEDLSITDICYEVGFRNVRTFNRAFLKSSAMTPSAYRKNLRSL